MSIRRVVLFIGPPGSGKGTLSQLCVQKLGWVQISTGDLCRQHMAQGSDLGKKIDFAIKSGKLVSDALINAMVFDWFKEYTPVSDTVILDGYPRTVQQAKDFKQLLSQFDPSLALIVVAFDIDDKTVIERLSSRYVCQNKECQKVYSLRPGSSLAPQKEMICDDCGDPLGRRKDDEPVAIKERLKVYHQHEQELLSFYKKSGYSIWHLKSDMPLKELFALFKEKMGGC